MKELAEKLIKKHLLNSVESIAKEVLEENFDSVFKEFCQQETSDTTISETFSKLKEMVNKTVSKKLNENLSVVTSEMGIVRCSPNGNPFALIAYELWEEFLCNYSVIELVDSYINDECNERQSSLTKLGILDENGDYIKQ